MSVRYVTCLKIVFLLIVFARILGKVVSRFFSAVSVLPVYFVLLK